MDGGRVILAPLILFFRNKRIYTDGSRGKQKIRELKGALVAANHTGFSDPFILNACFWYRRFFYTASEEVMAGFKGKLLTAAGCIKVDRTAADLKSTKECAQVMKEGYLLGIFPQGRIGGDGLKSGFILMAAMAGVPIVPAHIEKRKHFWQRHRVVFGEPMYISDYTSKALPGKKDMEAIIAAFNRQIDECQKCISN